MDLFGDSRESQFRYHEWCWNNRSGATVVHRVDTGSTFASTETVSADGFNGGEPIEVTLQTWSSGFGVGSTATADQDDHRYPCPRTNDHRPQHRLARTVDRPLGRLQRRRVPLPPLALGGCQRRNRDDRARHDGRVYGRR